jgi:hypothetical protein
VDANLYPDIITGRLVTGILHLCNQTLIESFSKRQACVQTATFGSEFVAARIAVDQIVDLRNTLRYLGVPVQERSFLFGDNRAVVNNSAIPISALSKRHNELLYHRVREAIAAGMVNFYWIDGKSNPANIVSKHLDYPQVWHMLQPILFYSGDTKTLLKNNDPISKTSSTESKKMDDNGLEKHEPIKVKIRDGEENGQKKKMQQVSEPLHPYVPGSTLTSSVARTVGNLKFNPLTCRQSSDERVPKQLERELELPILTNWQLSRRKYNI